MELLEDEPSLLLDVLEALLDKVPRAKRYERPPNAVRERPNDRRLRRPRGSEQHHALGFRSRPRKGLVLHFSDELLVEIRENTNLAVGFAGLPVCIPSKKGWPEV